MRSDLEALGRLRLQAILLLLLVFSIGALAGAAVMRTVDRLAAPDRFFPEPPPGLPPDLERELALTPDQEERIAAIFEAARPRSEQILREARPRLRSITDSVKTEVRHVLTVDQQKIYDRWSAAPHRDRPRHGPPDRRFGPPGLRTGPPDPRRGPPDHRSGPPDLRHPPPGAPSNERTGGSPRPEGPIRDEPADSAGVSGVNRRDGVAG